MFERFTDRARRVVTLAQEEAKELNHGYIGTEHILLGMIQEGEGVAAKALESLGISLEAVREQVEEIIGRGSQQPTGHIPFTPRAKKVLDLSLREAKQLRHNYIGTEHILLGLIREGEGVAAQVLVKLGADLNRVRQQVIQLLTGYKGKDEVRFAEVPIRRLAVNIDRFQSSVELSVEEENGEPRQLTSASVTFRDSNGATVTRRLGQRDIATIGEGRVRTAAQSGVTVSFKSTTRGVAAALTVTEAGATFEIIGASLSYVSGESQISKLSRVWLP